MSDSTPKSNLNQEQEDYYRKFWEKEESYDNSFSKNSEAGYTSEIKIRVANAKTNFSNLKLDFYDWDFELRIGEPYQVVRIAGYYHEYDNCLYCYPLDLGRDPEVFKDKLIPFSKTWDIIKWSYGIVPSTSYKWKWDEVRHMSSITGTLLRNGKPFYKTSGRNDADVFARLLLAKNEANEHIANFAQRNWKEKIIGSKIWYESNPCIISGIHDYDCVMFRISPDNEEKTIHPPVNWEDDEESICSKSSWYAENFHNSITVEWNCQSIKWFRK
jgi:hypothetical protein